MKRVAIILLLLAHLSQPADYTFRSAWNRPSDHNPCKIHFTDLNGDGLSEILYFDIQVMEPGYTTLTALDTVGNVLWEIEPGKQGCCYLFFEDLDCNGTQEIYSLLSMVSSLDEKKFDKITYNIACFDERGNIVWSHEVQTTLERTTAALYLFRCRK